MKNNLLVLFYGIGRSPKCIDRNIDTISACMSPYFDITYSYALNNINIIKNPRTKENSFLNKKEISNNLKEMDLIYTKDQLNYELDFKESILGNLSFDFNDPYKDNNRTLCNLFCQLSLLTDFIENNHIGLI